jgi:hypothetical protein
MGRRTNTLVSLGDISATTVAAARPLATIAIWFLVLAVLPQAARAAVPVITKNPTNVSITTNAAAAFSVTASGAPAPSYQWQISFDDVNFTPIDNFIWSANAGGTVANTADTASLNLPNVPYNLDGPLGNTWVRCMVYNSFGFALSTAATLNVSVPGTATKLYTISDPGGLFETAYYSGMNPPFHKPLLSGATPSSVTFTFGFGGGGGEGVTVVWQTSANGLTGWSTATGFQISADGLTLTDTSPTTSQSGTFFRAVVTDIKTPTTTVTTNPARLDVEDPIVANSNSALDGTTNGSNSGRVSLGSVVVFAANAKGASTLSYAWQRSTNFGVSWSAAGMSTAATQSVTVTSLTQNQYMYQCVVTDSAGSTSSDPMVLSVTP